MAWKPGKQLRNGKYTIERTLGEGQDAITYLAFDSQKRRLVIKTLKDSLLADPNEREKRQERLMQEAVKLAQCQHPHIAKVQGELFTEQEDDCKLVCIPMEYIAGVDLASLPQKVLPESLALHYIRQIAEALIVVHRQGLLHLDVKPQNIMVRLDKPEAVLIDFGLARELNSALSRDTTSPGFAPLELYLSTKMPPDCRTDIYSLAATLYTLLTGIQPPDAKKRLGGERLKSPKDINPEVSSQVSDAIVKGMALEADARPQDMQAWLEQLGLQRRTLPFPLLYRDPVLFWTIVGASAGWVAAVGTWLAIWVTLNSLTPTQTVPENSLEFPPSVGPEKPGFSTKNQELAEAMGQKPGFWH